MSPQVAKDLTDIIKEKVKDMGYDRYKLVVQVCVGQKKGQAMRFASRCLWDTSCDNYASEFFENKTLYCVAQARQGVMVGRGPTLGLCGAGAGARTRRRSPALFARACEHGVAFCAAEPPDRSCLRLPPPLLCAPRCTASTTSKQARELLGPASRSPRARRFCQRSPGAASRAGCLWSHLLCGDCLDTPSTFPRARYPGWRLVRLARPPPPSPRPRGRVERDSHLYPDSSGSSISLTIVVSTWHSGNFACVHFQARACARALTIA